MEANHYPEEKEKAPLNLKTVILIVSFVVNIVSASFVCVIFLENRSLTSEVAHYKNLSEFYYSLAKSEGTVNSSIKIVGVREKDPYEGVVMVAKIELRIGEGIPYVGTQPAKIGTVLQESLETAIIVAKNTLRLPLKDVDVLLTIKSEEEIDIVDGPSAGAAITVALMAAIQNQIINNNVYITGEINSDGTIGRVGRLLKKALAAAENGAKEFLVPPGQSKVNGIRIEEYLSQRGYSTVVIEVSTIRHAYQRFTRSS
ncbi:MAG: DNA-binding ATP-dependent protease La [Candidatus Bathyarchaeota archaeon BA2]|nr:MAG: DNA-binding ATP-dependent protease La [Candidatus Bathyarchaeota archaeon BA2]